MGTMNDVLDWIYMCAVWQILWNDQCSVVMQAVATSMIKNCCIYVSIFTLCVFQYLRRGCTQYFCTKQNEQKLNDNQKSQQVCYCVSSVYYRKLILHLIC